MKHAPGMLLLLSLCVALAGCGGEAKVPPLTAEHAIGRTMTQVASHLDPEQTLLVQDVSVLVNEEPTYDVYDQDSDRWLVIAACSLGPTLEESDVVELAVVPIEPRNTPARERLEERIEDGDFARGATCDFDW